MNTVEIKPELIDWAINRSMKASAVLKKFPTIKSWGKESNPTLRQLEQLAKMTFTPLGYFFLPKPPEDKLPIPDCRTVTGIGIQRPSPDLIETIQIMQRRQDWMRDYLIEQGENPLPFIASASLSDNVIKFANDIRAALRLKVDWAQESTNWTKALILLSESVEEAGILIVFNGVVGNNTHRNLNVEEFRGFVLSDKYAPLIFINSKDAKAAQMFTIVHELVHLWLGINGVINFRAMQPANNDTEKFCDQVAAEFLVPKEQIHACWPQFKQSNEPFQELARQFKVSPIVCARRTLDLNLITKAEFFNFYNLYLEDERRSVKRGSGGGDFYATQNTRIGRHFFEVVSRATKEGQLLYRDAYQLTGLHGKTFDEYIKKIDQGVRL
ncbi:MAG: ImmA/IrrE family metallo-endopeptidase [Candidatus Desantisbacteria bacterium]